MMLQTLSEGFFLGLATGLTCLSTCTPIYLPYLMTANSNITKSILAVLEISAGRFFSYLAFGAIAGFAGAQIVGINRSLFTSIAYILLSIFLLLSVVRTHKKHKKCHIPRAVQFTKSGFILGILTGINFCPSFLIALSKAMDLGGAVNGMTLFLGFFFGTTIFLIPLAFANLLSKIKEIKLLAHIATIFVVVWFTFTGVKGLLDLNKAHEDLENSRIIDVFENQKHMTIIASSDNMQYFNSLKDSLMNRSSETVIIKEVVNFGINFDDVQDSTLLFIDQSLLRSASIAEEIEDMDRFIIDEKTPIKNIIEFLSRSVFKADETLYFEFTDNHNH